MKQSEIEEQLLTREQVLEMLQIKATKTLMKWIAAGGFPEPIRCGPTGRVLRWRREQVDQYLNQRVRPEAANVG